MKTGIKTSTHEFVCEGGDKGLDVLKLLLSILILLRHCAQGFFAPQDFFSLIIIDAISPVAVPTFFVLSGFLFYRKDRDKKALWNYSAGLRGCIWYGASSIPL